MLCCWESAVGLPNGSVGDRLADSRGWLAEVPLATDLEQPDSRKIFIDINPQFLKTPLPAHRLPHPLIAGHFRVLTLHQN